MTRPLPLLALVFFALLIASVLSACSAPDNFTRMIDSSACQERWDGGPRFDGAAWLFEPAGQALRCPLPVEIGETVLEWSVWLHRDALGPNTSARLQRHDVVENLMYDVGPTAADATQGPDYVSLAMPRCPQPPPKQCLDPYLVNEDNTLSLYIVGSEVGGDRFAGARLQGTRL